MNALHNGNDDFTDEKQPPVSLTTIATSASLGLSPPSPSTPPPSMPSSTSTPSLPSLHPLPSLPPPSSFRNEDLVVSSNDDDSQQEVYVRVDDEDDDERSSNERLLCTAFISFLSFALLQMVFAVIAGSTAMMGDSSAMIVDSMTYFFNWIAERRKHRLDELVAAIKLKQERHNATNNIIFNCDRCRKKLKLQMEIIPPMISLTTLTVVLVLVLRESIQTLVLGNEQSRRYLEKTPDLKLMIVFSSLNLLLDLFNVFCFARARHLLGWDVVDHDTVMDQEDSKDCDDDHENEDDVVKEICWVEGEKLDDPLSQPSRRMKQKSINTYIDGDIRLEPLEQHGNCNQYDCEQGRKEQCGIHKHDKAPSCDSHSCKNGKAASVEEGKLGSDGAPVRRRRANLNMCSAYTHVFADTLRSSAVILAAVIALLVPTISPESADATAAVVVCFLIFMSMIPLVRGLTKSLRTLLSIIAEERSEAATLHTAISQENIPCTMETTQ